MQTAEFLAKNLRALRESRGLSQEQIARLAGVPRPTWANLESGDSNPTLAVLSRVASALQVRLDELLAAPHTLVELHAASSLPRRTRGTVSIRRLLPEPLPGLEIERMELPARASFAGVPHTPGTREYLTCEVGVVELRVAGERYSVTPGDVIVFQGDQKHGYSNPTDRTSIAYSVVTFAKTS